MRICETFYSIQGEGLQMGVPTFFIRASGCNLECSWCDTGYARQEGEDVQLQVLVDEALASKASSVCITGGEPLIQDEMIPLIQLLLGQGLGVTLETNGSVSLEELPCDASLMVSLDIKCPSSGMEDRMVLENLELLGPMDQVKFVVADVRDYDYVKGIILERELPCTVILTPVGGLEMRWLAEAVLDDGLRVRVLPQLHKMIWGDERKR